MKRLSSAIGATAIVFGALAAAPSAGAAQVAHDTTTYAPSPAPTITMLDCQGTTGSMGCGPGWSWRDGWRGFACYPC